MRERSIQNRIRDVYRDRGAFVVKYHAAGYGTDGVPDLLVCYRGIFVAVEVKQPGKRASRIQEVRLAQVRAAEGVAGVASSVEEALELLAEVDRRMAA